MSIIPSLLTENAFIQIPQGLLEWIACIILSASIILLLRKWRRFNKPMTENRWGILLLLSISVPLTSLMIGLRLPASVVTPPPNFPVDPAGPALMIFSTIPWMLAAGLLGPISAAGTAFYSGIFLAFWETHNPFTPLILAFLATIFSAAISQRYRKQIFSLIRHPLVSAALISLIYPFLFLIITPITAHLYPEARIEYTITHLSTATLVTSIQLLIGGITAELVAMALPDEWGERGPLQISPVERTIEARLLYFLAPLAIVTIIALIAGDWYFAGRSARGMIENSMRNSAQVAAKNVPSFLEIGQILIMDMSAKFTTADFSEINKLNQTLAGGRAQQSFFDQFLLFNRKGELVTAYPDQTLTQSSMPDNEIYAVDDALDGFPISIIPAASEDFGESGVVVSFVAPVFNEQQQPDGAIVGRTYISTNQILQPTKVSFAGLADVKGEGFIVADNGTILLHSDPAGEQTEYEGLMPEDPELFEDRARDGKRSLIYYKPIEGTSWSVIVSVPKIQSEMLAITVAIPIFVISLVLAILTFVLIRMGLSSVSGSLKSIAVEAERMSVGDLNQPIPVASEDEVGILGQSFEKMRRNLKKRLDEMDRLFAVSQEVASNLVIEEAIQPVLDAAMVAGVSSVRVVLPSEVIPEMFGDELTPIVYSAGSSGHVFDYLDDQILAYLRRHDRLILPNLSRPRIFDLPDDEPHPNSLIAFSLRKEDTYYGAFWTTYDQIHDFEQGEINYFNALANQATTAATNTRLYLSAEVERQRLSAIIASSPDPVLVTDKQNCLVLVNPAAAQVLDIPLNYRDISPIDQVIQQAELVDLLESSVREKQTLDIEMPDGKIYLAIATSVIADGQPVGRVCTLRDVTRVKEVNALKSEFVSTVSHDLRSPLALIHGYATMVEMVGKLNEEQANYLEKIIENVESMSHLVNNLLDLRRIEAGIGLQLEMVAVREIVQQVVDSLSVHAAQKRIQVRLNVPFDTVPLIEADHALLQKAIYNLVDNAIKFSHLDGQVDIKVYMKQDRMYFEISDTGSGISPVDQEQLFEKFFYRTTQDGVHEARGSGLGLAIVKSIADRHHGEVWVESQLGKGSTFYLVIPLRQSDVTEQKRLDTA